jgi:hypothetical protein
MAWSLKIKTIRCTVAAALQGHIKYVKRLLQILSWITENTEYVLSLEIRTTFIKLEPNITISRKPNLFCPVALSLRDF